MAYIAKCTIVAGAAAPVLQTAISNTNTAIAAAVTTAIGTANYIDQSVKVTPLAPVFDATNYVYSAAVQFYVSA